MSLRAFNDAALLVTLLGLLAACTAPPTTRAPPAAAPPAAPRAAPAPAPAARLYRIDPASSDVRIFVTRAGPLAKLGHDHVIDAHALSGWARYSGSLDQASFALEVPVAALSVDDARLRSEAGGDFAEPLGEAARNGTRENMLSPALLDAARYPAIVLRSVTVAGAWPHLDAVVDVELAGHASRQQLAFDVSASARELHAHGELELKQSALGLTPFSLLLGALRVEDVVLVRFDVTATAPGRETPSR